MKIEVFEVDTESGRKRISMKTTGNGAWITVTRIVHNTFRGTRIRRVVWIPRAEDIGAFIEKCTD